MSHSDFEINTQYAKDMSITEPVYTTSERAYKYAMDMTKREVYQAVEGLLHNLK